MAIQRTTVVVEVVLSYDDDVLNEGQAQERWLQDVQADVKHVTTEKMEILAGLVDEDGVALQDSKLVYRLPPSR